MAGTMSANARSEPITVSIAIEQRFFVFLIIFVVRQWLAFHQA
jgi:hypothetical protein